jgi:hypothetical protein
MSYKKPLSNLFKKETNPIVGKIVSKSGYMYTIQDQQGRTYIVYSDKSLQLDSWVISESSRIIDSVSAPPSTKKVMV